MDDASPIMKLVDVVKSREAVALSKSTFIMTPMCYLLLLLLLLFRVFERSSGGGGLQKF